VIQRRLDALHSDLAESPDQECAIAVARVFNALLAEVRGHFETDPVIKSMAALRPSSDDGKLPSVRTVQTLVGQLRAALPDGETRQPRERHS
jgi:hypothetical protein